MLTTTYTVIQGMLVHENREGVETFYVPDTQGSLMECRSALGVKTYEAEYWPYGEVRTSTGSNPSPWNFVGLLGYFRDLSKLLYVRTRHYRPDLARWQTVDPLWPGDSAYGYVDDNPAGHVDPSGLTNFACVACGVCLGIGGLAALLACGTASFLRCAICWCLRNPVACTLIATACVASCIVCAPAFVRALQGLLQRLLRPGMTGLPAPAYARHGSRRSDPCEDSCDFWLYGCQAACDRGSSGYDGGWRRCCLQYCQNNWERCKRGDVPFPWSCDCEDRSNHEPTVNPFPARW